MPSTTRLPGQRPTLFRLLWFAITPLVSALVCSHSTLGATDPPLIVAVRAGDRAQMEAGLRRNHNDAPVDARDDHGNSALHWAALARDSEAVARLLAAGCDPRATNNAGATPLHYGVGSARIVAALLKAGADPNARSLAGSTPLHSAAARTDSYAQVKLLLAAGADVQAAREPRAPFEGRETALSLAAFAGDERTVRLLLDRGASPGRASDLHPPDASPAGAAVFGGHEKILKLLVERGATLNYADGFAGHTLNTAFYAGHRPMIKMLLAEEGIDLHQKSGMSESVPPIVWSAYNEAGEATFTRELIARGLDMSEETSAGNTVLSWASKRGETDLVRFLRSQSGRSTPPIAVLTSGQRKSIPNNPVPQEPESRDRMIRGSVQRAIKLLQHGSDGFLDNGFVQQASCVSCHHQTLPAVTFALAEERGFELDRVSLARQLAVQQSGWSKTRDQAFEMHAPQPAAAAVLGYGLNALHALRYEPDDLTAAMTYYLAETQRADGSWPDYDFRPPMESGPIVGTALALKALQDYPPAVATIPVAKRIRNARRYLEQARPINLSQQVFRYHGLSWAGATPAQLRRLTDELLALQRADGGWAPLPTLESDAWATGHTLVALHQAGGVPTSDPAYQRGLEFLLRTQFEDGSWLVKSRTWPFQPHFDSHFPHGKDQWISAGGTAWAAMALLLAVDAPSTHATLPTAQERIRFAEFKTVRAQPETTRGNLSSEEKIDFNRDIRPVLERSCIACHSGEKPKGGYSLSGREAALKGGQSGEPAITPATIERSALMRFVQDKVEDLEMPPLNKRNKFPALSPSEIKKMEAWIEQGAPWPEGVMLKAETK